jgi:parallel beta-helix repeat protein
MNNNNTRKINALWDAGGLKATTKAYGTIEYSEVGFNNGSGIWFDYANSGNAITIRNNYIHDNGPLDAAIFFEVSKNGRIYNNIIANNQRRGIYLSASDNTQVYNNTVFGTAGYAGIEIGGMPRTGATLTGNIIQNNIISHGTSKYDLFMAVANGTTISGNTSDYNNYYRPGSAIQLSSGIMYYNINSFSTATNMDKHSMNIDPLFASLVKPTNAKSYAVRSASGTIDSGIANGSASHDYENVKRPNGIAFDLGAFENIGVTDIGSNDTSPPIISIYSPLLKSTISQGSPLNITAKATDNVRVKLMSIYVDGILFARSSSDAVSYTWNSAGARVGTHSMYISAIDDKNNTAKQVMTFVVK